MISVSNEFNNILKQDLIDQKIKGKVVINYTDPFLDNTITQTVSEENRISELPQTTNGRYKTSFKYISLDESCVLDGSYHPLPATDYLKTFNEMGWWGNQRSGSDCKYSEPFPEMIIDFEKRNITEIRIVGDDKRGEYPVNFTLDFYDMYYSPIDSRYFTNNDKVNFIFPLLSEIKNVEKIKLTITKWSHPGRVAKIIEFSPSLIVEYTEDVVSIELNESKETDFEKTFYGGIGNAEIDINIDNTERFFDINNLNSSIRNYIKPNRRIEPFIGIEKENKSIEYVKLGIFYSDDFNVSESGKSASIHGWNRLTLFENTIFTMSSVELNYSFYDFFQLVLNDAGIANFELSIDESLKNDEYIIPVAFVKTDTHLEVLKKLCNASLTYLYIDRNGIFRVEGIKYVDDSSYNVRDIVTPDEFYNKANPFKYGNIVNSVSINITPLDLQDAKEVYSKTLTIAGTPPLNPDDPPEIPRIYTKEIIKAKYKSAPIVNHSARIEGAPADINIINEEYFPEYCNITIQNETQNNAEIKIIIEGQQYKNEYKDTYTTDNELSIKMYGKKEYIIDDNELIQTEKLAEHLISNILESCHEPDNVLELEYIGNPALELNDRLHVQDKYTHQHFHIDKQTISFDGSLNTKIEGKKAKITPDYDDYVYGDSFYTDLDDNYYQGI